MDEDFVYEDENPSKASEKKPEKSLTDVSSFANPFFGSSTSNTNGEEDESFGIIIDSPQKTVLCPICNKDISHLNSVRRVAHTNECLDGQQTKENFKKAKERHSATVDCPMCGKPLPPGPHRAAHAKQCARQNNLSGKNLLTMMECQSKISSTKKQKGENHTSAPKPQEKKVLPPKLAGEPKSHMDEQIQLAKALSESILDASSSEPKFKRVEDTKANTRRRPRSYSIIQFAPHDCKCDVLSTIQDKFLERFRVKKKKSLKQDCSDKRAKADMFSIEQTKLLNKMAHLEALSADLLTMLNPKSGDFTIICRQGNLTVHKDLLKSRTKCQFSSNDFSFVIDEPIEVVRHWVNYVYTGKVGWSRAENEAIKDLGERFGPACILMAYSDDPEPEVEPVNVVPEVSSQDEVFDPSMDPQQPEGHEIVLHEIIKEEGEVKEEEEDKQVAEFDSFDVSDIITTKPSGSNSPLLKSIDCEDPMEGITISQNSSPHTIVPESEDDDVIVLDDSPPPPSKRSPKLFIPETVEPLLTPTKQPSAETEKDANDSWSLTPLKLDPVEEAKDKKEDINVQPSCSDGSPDKYDVFDNDIPNNAMFNADDYYGDEFWTYEPEPSCSTSTPKSSTRTSQSQEVQNNRGKSSISSRRSLKRSNSEVSQNLVDSFDDSIIIRENVKSREVSPFEPPLAQSTPVQPAVKKLKFGSNVKILKTSAITPQANYDGMTDKELEAELARNGLRPMVRKKAVMTLKRIYDSLHPVVDPSTPTLRPLVKYDNPLIAKQNQPKPRVPKLKTSVNKPTTPQKQAPPQLLFPASPSSSDDCLGNQTLNDPMDEPMEESMLEDVGALPKDINGMTTSLLNWLRKPENEELYNHMLCLHPVMIEEFYVRLCKADDPASLIPKKTLATILDNLGVTFSLPQANWGRKGAGGRKTK